MEGNLCWNCRHLVSCNPERRPNSRSECAAFKPMYEPITAEQLAEILGITERAVRSFIQRNETDRIVQRIQTKDKNIGFVRRNGKIKFYRLNADTGMSDKK